jgi:putative membrane protein insertion efficiency factor
MTLRKVLVLPIRFYRYFLSPLFPARCRFFPTCSAYAHEAILQYGIVKGGLLALFRIARCAPWSAGGYDPVPPPGSARSSEAKSDPF